MFREKHATKTKSKQIDIHLSTNDIGKYSPLIRRLVNELFHIPF